MLLMWLEIVWVLRWSWRAICWLGAPLARSVKISSSRSVSAARIARGGVAGCGDGDLELADPLEQRAGDLRGERALSCGGGSDGVGDVLGR